MIKSLQGPLNPLGIVIENPRSLLQMTSTSEVFNLEREGDGAFCCTPPKQKEEERQRQPVIVSTRSVMATAMATFVASKELPVAVTSSALSPATSSMAAIDSECVI